MNYLSVQNSFLKPRNSNTFLSDLPFKSSYFNDTRASLETTKQIETAEKKLEEIWSKEKFTTGKVQVENVVSFPNNVKTSWALEEAKNQVSEGPSEEQKMDESPQKSSEDSSFEKDETSPSHHARRPPNAFLIFCKKHRPIVRQRFPNLENRGVTKILGEWWALLEIQEKQPYNDLAKEYKEAFLSAHPNFRWYKLPAPPLRTLTTRPATVSKTSVSSPTNPSEFTPGKLADESQLGGLTSLMNNFNSTPKEIENNNNEKPCLPPKKRIFEQYVDSLECNSNMTNQDLLEKVVDDIFAKDNETRKSDRVCKGKRYERFMVEGKLLGNKRDHKLTQQKAPKTPQKVDDVPKPETPKLDLDYTIKRLAERTNIKIEFDGQKDDINIETKLPERVRSISETSDTPTTNFNLDLRISNLTSLSYDDFIMRKRESKKRKNRTRSESKFPKVDKVGNQPVGSKKRKNKHSITHLKEEELSTDLLGLATLAMVAANTEKINE